MIRFLSSYFVKTLPRDILLIAAWIVFYYSCDGDGDFGYNVMLV